MVGELAGAPGVEPGSEDSQSPMLSITPCPCECKAGGGTRIRTGVQGFEIPDAIHYTIPPNCFTGDSVCTCVETYAATLPKPGSVALTAMTEGPLQRELVVEFWSPHITHLSGSAITMPVTYKKLSLIYRLPEI